MDFRGSRLRRFASVLLIVYWTALFVGTHIPLRAGSLGGLNDKLVHFAAYAGLAFLLSLVFASSRRSLRAILWVLAAAAVYGAVDELSQLAVPGRHGDAADWLANMGGAAFGLVGYLVACLLVPLRSSAASEDCSAATSNEIA